MTPKPTRGGVVVGEVDGAAPRARYLIVPDVARTDAYKPLALVLEVDAELLAAFATPEGEGRRAS